MSTEGFVFAKLPKCFSMPQLQNWLMYRKGFVQSKSEKVKSLMASISTWDSKKVKKLPEIPHMEMSKRQLAKLTFENAEEIKSKVAKKKAIFYSNLKKAQVLNGREYWNTMEFDKFPSLPFKKAYFTYTSTKEADGHVYNPWIKSEARKRK